MERMEEKINCPELIEKILFCLPQKPRSKFKCVSRTWCDIINYINAHLPPSGLVLFSYLKQRQPAITTLIDDGESCKAVRSFDIPLDVPMLLGSQNGLLLLRSTMTFDTQFFLCNPAILDEKGRYVALPRMHKPLEPFNEAGVLFDGSSSRDKFKVVCFKLDPKSFDAGKIKTYLLSSDTMEWREQETMMRKPLQQWFEVEQLSYSRLISYYRRVQQVSLCYKRKLHWLYEKFVLIYDFDKQFIEIVNLPSKILRSRNSSRGLLYETEGTLFYCRSTMDRLTIWAYCSHGDDKYWQQKEVIYYQEDAALPRRSLQEIGSSQYLLCPMAFNQKLQSLHLHRRQSIYSYSLNTQKLTMVWSFPPADTGPSRGTWIGFPYSM